MAIKTNFIKNTAKSNEWNTLENKMSETKDQQWIKVMLLQPFLQPFLPPFSVEQFCTVQSSCPVLQLWTCPESQHQERVQMLALLAVIYVIQADQMGESSDAERRERGREMSRKKVNSIWQQSWLLWSGSSMSFSVPIQSLPVMKGDIPETIF